MLLVSAVLLALAPTPGPPVEGTVLSRRKLSRHMIFVDLATDAGEQQLLLRVGEHHEPVRDVLDQDEDVVGPDPAGRRGSRSARAPVQRADRRQRRRRSWFMLLK